MKNLFFVCFNAIKSKKEQLTNKLKENVFFAQKWFVFRGYKGSSFNGYLLISYVTLKLSLYYAFGFW